MRLEDLPHLGSGDDHSTINMCTAEVLHNRKVLIRSTRGCVHHQIIHVSPVHVTQELLDKTCMYVSACVCTMSGIGKMVP